MAGTQSEYWDGRAGEHWVEERDRYDATLRPFGRALLEAAAIGEGERVLDVGCGNADTTIQLARRVGARGSVTGIDLSGPMLRSAEERIAAEGLSNVTLVQGDAQTHPFEEGTFDALVSRFGVMFFADPPAAFANLARALRPGGRVAFVCWQEVFKNEWIMVPAAAVVEHVGMPELPDADAPGPFAFADPQKVRDILDTAGFTDVTLESLTMPAPMGTDVEDTVQFFSRSDMAEEILGRASEDQVTAALDAMREALRSYAGPDGVVLTGTAWLVMARRP
jgi:SAM-dependent methyltransferase